LGGIFDMIKENNGAPLIDVASGHAPDLSHGIQRGQLIRRFSENDRRRKE
jgi:hypothetical protein